MNDRSFESQQWPCTALLNTLPVPLQRMAQCLLSQNVALFMMFVRFASG